MKKILSLFIILAITFSLKAQTKIENLVKVGSKLIYAVESNGNKYDFIITLKKLQPAVIFGWEMTDPINTKGTITHTAKAMASGNTMYNYFSPGDKKLDDKTLSVWLSKSVLAGLNKTAKGIKMKMNTDAESKTMGTFTGDLKLEILIDGKAQEIEESLAKELVNGSPDGDDFFTFYNSAKLPLILRMHNGFYIGLKEIKTK